MWFANRHLFFPNRTRKTRAVFFALGVAVGLAVSGSAADSASQNAATPTAKSGTADVIAASSSLAKSSPSPETTGSDVLENLPMPIGRDFEGVNLPWYDANGHLQMNFHIAKARRTDKDHLDLQQLYVNTYAADGSPDATIQIKSAVLNLVTKILTSKEPVTVERSDFEIVGQQLEFNTVTHEGKFIGKVKMLIYNNQPQDQSKGNPKGGA